jgi:serine/threonine protein kinase
VHYFEQFVRGIQAIHLQGISHRDIKCENIFIDDQYNLKIADFGFAAPISGLKTILGT